MSPDPLPLIARGIEEHIAVVGAIKLQRSVPKDGTSVVVLLPTGEV